MCFTKFGVKKRRYKERNFHWKISATRWIPMHEIPFSNSNNNNDSIELNRNVQNERSCISILNCYHKQKRMQVMHGKPPPHSILCQRTDRVLEAPIEVRSIVKILLLIVSLSQIAHTQNDLLNWFLALRCCCCCLFLSIRDIARCNAECFAY